MLRFSAAWIVAAAAVACSATAADRYYSQSVRLVPQGNDPRFGSNEDHIAVAAVNRGYTIMKDFSQHLPDSLRELRFGWRALGGPLEFIAWRARPGGRDELVVVRRRGNVPAGGEILPRDYDYRIGVASYGQDGARLPTVSDSARNDVDAIIAELRARKD